MVALLREFPDVRVDVQSGAVAAGAARGVRRGSRARPHLDLGLKPADAADRRRQRVRARRTSSTRSAQRMIDAYPRYARAAAPARSVATATRGVAVHRRRLPRPAGVAEARLGRPVLSRRAIRASWRCIAKGTRTSPRRTRRSLRAVELEVLQRGDPRVPGRGGPRPGRDLPRRRSTTRSCRCCATPTSTCGRIRSRRCRGSGFSIRRTRASSSNARPPATNACSASRPSGSGRRKGRSRTRWCRWSAGAGFSWMATDEQILARSLGMALHARPVRACRAAGAAVRAVSTFERAAPRSPACSATTCCRI